MFLLCLFIWLFHHTAKILTCALPFICSVWINKDALEKQIQDSLWFYYHSRTVSDRLSATTHCLQQYFCVAAVYSHYIGLILALSLAHDGQVVTQNKHFAGLWRTELDGTIRFLSVLSEAACGRWVESFTTTTRTLSTLSIVRIRGMRTAGGGVSGGGGGGRGGGRRGQRLVSFPLRSQKN